MARVQISVGNELATELGNDRDAMLKALIERIGVNAYLRGNELTLDGDDGDAVERARSVVEELAQLVAEGVSVGAQTVDAVAGVLTADGRAVDVLHDVVWMHRGNKVTPKTIVPEALRRRHPLEHGHVRDRPGRHRQDVPRDRPGRRRAAGARGGAHHPHPARRRGRRAARVPARRPAGQGRSLPAAALRRAARHARRRAACVLHGQGHGRGGPARVHARAHAERLVHHPRRGPEHEPRADADVPDPARVRLEGRRHGRHHPDRPAARPALRPRAT